MPLATFSEYLKCVDVIISEQQLRNIEAALSPNMKKESRRDVISGYRQRIKSSVDRTEGKLATVQDLAKAFARIRMNG